ncbi:MAG TPA: ATP-binding protein, partial [Pyrinomonadaceae bacterium]|nr:ATP-binding protein [Pyrinomonadaceae bacterium]
PPGTGKTTLVEALALSAERPLIRLSPSDLVVQGPAAIEGRARNVFEALCMLTQVVIILDEFEDVVGKRGESNGQHGESKIFEFLRTGMLPKLVKLNDAARKQSFVYCLATNYLTKIELAAQRKGRFDLRLPVYDPDPVSRAGTLLYRCYRVVAKLGDAADEIIERKSLARRFLEVVAHTRGTRANSFAEDYLRLPDWVITRRVDPPDSYEAEIPVYWYILTGKDVGYDDKIRAAISEGQRSQTDRANFEENDATKEEKKQSAWLDRYEKQLIETLKKESDISLDDLWACLVGPTEQMAAGSV